MKFTIQDMNSYQELEDYFKKISHLSNISSIINWDSVTYMPSEASADRGAELSTLSGIIHKMQTDKSVIEAVKKLEDETNQLNEWQKKNLKLIRRQFENNEIINEKLQAQHTKISKETQSIWQNARKSNDFDSVFPALEKMFATTKEIADIKSKHFNVSPYDALLDNFDPERKEAEVAEIFDHTKAHLPKLISKIIDKQRNIKYLPIDKPVDAQTQTAIEKRLIQTLGLDMNKARLDETVHPFCAGSREDVRLTTHHRESDLLFSAYAVIHETGHGLYQQNLPFQYRNQPVGNHMGMSFHESQSLFMEKQVGSLPEFCEFYAKLLRDEFGFKGEEYRGENLFNLKTRVKPGKIRIEADEVTYPLHVILRYELEKQLLNADITVKDLPHLWNVKMKEYLNIEINNDAEGYMQDTHWFMGAIGYFPCYYLGAIIASMTMAKLKQENTNLLSQIQGGDFAQINDHLTKNMRSFGSLYDSKTLLKKSTDHENISVDIFFDYLQNKYL